jgi:integrase
MRRQKLSAKAVEKLRRAGRYADGQNLYLSVVRSGPGGRSISRSWVFRYVSPRFDAEGRRIPGVPREMGIGSLRDVSLKEARRKAGDARKLLDDNIDPLEHKRAQQRAEALRQARGITFAQACRQYIAANEPTWRNAKHRYQWEQTLGEAYCGAIRAQPIADVDTAALLRVLQPIWHTKHETATRLRARVERVLDWAITHGLRDGPNPAKWKGHLQHSLPMRKKRDRVKHYESMPYQQVPAFMDALRAQPGVAPRALELAILCATRTGETLKARPEEFDLDKALWTVPAAHTKSGRQFRIPLSPRAVEIVKAQIDQGGECIFPSTRRRRPLSNMALLMLLRRMGQSVTTHGFRSSFRIWLSERTAYPRELCEMSLAHTVGDATEAAYQRSDLFEKRRRLMNEWTRYCEQPAKAGKLIKIKEDTAA